MAGLYSRGHTSRRRIQPAQPLTGAGGPTRTPHDADCASSCGGAPGPCPGTHALDGRLCGPDVCQPLRRLRGNVRPAGIFEHRLPCICVGPQALALQRAVPPGTGPRPRHGPVRAPVHFRPAAPARRPAVATSSPPAPWHARPWPSTTPLAVAGWPPRARAARPPRPRESAGRAAHHAVVVDPDVEVPVQMACRRLLGGHRPVRAPPGTREPLDLGGAGASPSCSAPGDALLDSVSRMTGVVIGDCEDWDACETGWADVMPHRACQLAEIPVRTDARRRVLSSDTSPRSRLNRRGRSPASSPARTHHS